jgi:hypothetical protein
MPSGPVRCPACKKTFLPPAKLLSPQEVKSLLRWPAICLVLVALLGLLFNSAFLALCILSPGVEPIPVLPQPVQALITNEVYIGMACFWIVYDLLMLAGAIQMARGHGYWLALGSAILAGINLSFPCCLLGIPITVWSLILLVRPEVRAAFP